MSYYRHHLFFCVNQRPAGERECCADKGQRALLDYAKTRIKALKLNGAQQIRVNQSGCLDRCELGPVLVVYPEGIWYRCFDTDDVEEIIQRHLIQGEIVSRLQLANDASQ